MWGGGETGLIDDVAGVWMQKDFNGAEPVDIRRLLVDALRKNHPREDVIEGGLLISGVHLARPSGADPAMLTLSVGGITHNASASPYAGSQSVTIAVK
jgi:hypothetical protein